MRLSCFVTMVVASQLVACGNTALKQTSGGTTKSNVDTSKSSTVTSTLPFKARRLGVNELDSKLSNVRTDTVIEDIAFASDNSIVIAVGQEFGGASIISIRSMPKLDKHVRLLGPKGLSKFTSLDIYSPQLFAAAGGEFVQVCKNSDGRKWEVVASIQTKGFDARYVYFVEESKLIVFSYRGEAAIISLQTMRIQQLPSAKSPGHGRGDFLERVVRSKKDRGTFYFNFKKAIYSWQYPSVASASLLAGERAIADFSVSNDDKILAYVEYQDDHNALKVLARSSNQSRLEKSVKGNQFVVQLSPTNRFVAVGFNRLKNLRTGGPYFLQLFDLASSRLVLNYECKHSWRFRQIRFSPNASKLIATFSPGQMLLLSIGTPTKAEE